MTRTDPLPDAGTPEHRAGDGPLVWVMSQRADVPRSVAELARRLVAEWPELSVLVSCAGGGVAPGARLPPAALRCHAPGDSARDVERALERWRPSAIILTEALLPAALIRMAGARGIPLFMVDGRGGPDFARGWPWWPGFTARLLRRFDRILVADPEAKRAFRRAGAEENRVEPVGLMAETPEIRAHAESERDALASRFNARPVWLAAAVPPAEEEMVLEAHRAAQRKAHRLMLVIVPRDLERGPGLARRVAAQMRVALRSDDEEPREDDQVYVADTEGEMGLWYRLAAVTYLGGSIVGAGSPLDPLEPAALGSVVIHGPRCGRWAAAVARLQQADALLDARDAASLSRGVGVLLTPERAAQMAHNAWEMLTEGSEATERIVALVLEVLNQREAS